MGALARYRTGAEDSIYRVTRVTIEGPMSDDICIRAWIDAEPLVELVSWAEEPTNHRYYVWRQSGVVALPKDCQLTLQTRDGKNGWATQAEADAVVAYALTASGKVDVTVTKANEWSLDPSKWFDDGGDEQENKWGWVKWAVGGTIAVVGIYSVAKLVRG